MTTLLDKFQLPASAAPARADRYVCDKCGRDVTRYIHPGRAHVWQAMGPVRFKCKCGASYLTGAAEWDHLGAVERRNRIFQTVGIALLLSTFFTVLVVLVLAIFYNGTHTATILWIITGAPFILICGPFLLSVGASIIRTRF